MYNGPVSHIHLNGLTFKTADASATALTAFPGEMCGLLQGGLCRFSELTPGQFGLTKQLVLRLALPHVTLLLVSLLYAAFGGWILTVIRYSDHNADDTALLVSTKADFTHFVASLNSSRSSILEEKFTHFVDDLHEIYSRNPFQWSRDITGSIHNNPLSNVTWNLFFAATTLTSIGYGTDAPDSLVGRIFCLVYLFFGIPLYLITLADLAKFCTELMNKIYIDIIKCKHRLKRKYRRWKSGRARRDSVKVGHLIIAGGEDEVAEFLWTHLEHAQFVEIPFLLIIGVLLVYIAFASYMISLIEGWQLSDGFYFMMISVLTIGFGDLVPRNEMFILIVLLLILVGLVLTTTCIDVVGAYYIDKLHFFGRRLDDDPLSWLKEVQQRRIEAMKREAMRKLFETVTALHHIRFTALKHLAQNVPEMLPDSPGSPRNLVASHATADSVLLRWCAPLYVDEGKRYWYTLTYKPRTPQRRNQVVRVDFINEEKYLVTGLKSFTLYEFSLTTTTRYGSSKSAKAQEYTEPCTVPQSLRLEAISCETATVSWRPPKVNNGAESYVIQFTQEPAPQFAYWNRYKVGDSTRFTLTDLLPDTRYILCVSAEHNYGLAAMSKSIRFRTKRWWADDDSTCLQLPFTNRRMSMTSVISSLSALR
uniref:Fibronectin type-III domain-containing protein n=1 Tax=Haemonchus contortus TaxID=6289 RepID=A0A7I4YUY9_HAECO